MNVDKAPLDVMRIVLPSAVRRGRLATAAVWRVTMPNGDVWQFNRRKDARAFAAHGGCPHGEKSRCWLYCRGYVVGRAGPAPCSEPP